MIQHWFSRITGGYQDQVLYAKIKKEEDFGLEQVEDWKKKFPSEYIINLIPNKPEEEWRYGEIEKIGDSVNKLIDGLKNIPLTSTTKPFIQDHLVSLASHALYLRRRMCQRTITVLLTNTSREKAQLAKEVIRALQCAKLTSVKLPAAAISEITATPSAAVMI